MHATACTPNYIRRYFSPAGTLLSHLWRHAARPVYSRLRHMALRCHVPRLPHLPDLPPAAALTAVPRLHLTRPRCFAFALSPVAASQPRSPPLLPTAFCSSAAVHSCSSNPSNDCSNSRSIDCAISRSVSSNSNFNCHSNCHSNGYSNGHSNNHSNDHSNIRSGCHTPTVRSNSRSVRSVAPAAADEEHLRQLQQHSSLVRHQLKP